jgi:hypothetical protein
MALLTQYTSFFVSPFGENSVTDELNTFLRSHRIINVEKILIDGERIETARTLGRTIPVPRGKLVYA